MVARVRVPDTVKRGEPFDVRIAIQHVMETGYRFDNAGRTIAKNVIHTLVARYDGIEVYRAELGSGIAANPYLQFWITAPASGMLELSWVDDAGVAGRERVPVTVRD